MLPVPTRALGEGFSARKCPSNSLMFKHSWCDNDCVDLNLPSTYKYQHLQPRQWLETLSRKYPQTRHLLHSQSKETTKEYSVLRNSTVLLFVSFFILLRSLWLQQFPPSCVEHWGFSWLLKWYPNIPHAKTWCMLLVDKEKRSRNERENFYRLVISSWRISHFLLSFYQPFNMTLK